MDYSSKKVSPGLGAEIEKALKQIGSHGSLEVVVVDYEVKQISIRSILKNRYIKK